MSRVLSGNSQGWLGTIAATIREAGKPASLDSLARTVPGKFSTAVNDGHVTAAENGLDRNDYRAGQRIWIEETVAALRRAGLVDGPDDAIVWTGPQDGTWKVKLGKNMHTIYGAAETAKARDQGMLGQTTLPPALVKAMAAMPAEEHRGMLLRAWTEVEVEVEVGIGSRIRKGRNVFQVHPLALALPPMTAAEQDGLRADIERHGVRQPLVLYPDQAEKTARGTPLLKVLDGRHRLQFASTLGKPVRVEVFDGTEEEARQLVASLNLHRRHLTMPQRALAVERLFGPQARAEAKKEQVRKPESVRPKLAEQNGPEFGGARWENRAVKRAGPAGIGVKPSAVRRMAKVAEAPETAARVDAGEITTVAAAERAAAAELGQPPPPTPWQGTVRTELGRARGHLAGALKAAGRDEQLGGQSDLAMLLTEVERLAGELRAVLAERGALEEERPARERAAMPHRHG